MTLVELGVSALLIERLKAKGIENPTPIQAEVFPLILQGASMVGLSKTGTGKTLAYLLPLVEKFMQDNQGTSALRLLVLVPTRELANQVQSTLQTLTGNSQSGVVIVGGESEETQIKASQSALAVIATPGRLLDLLKRQMIDTSQIEAVTFDEADRLLDMGFVDDMRAIRKLLPPRALQMLFFSATVHFGIEEMAYEFKVPDLLRIGKESDELTVEGLDHRVAFVGDQEKFHALANFLMTHKEGRGIVFSNYRERAHDISYRLRGLGAHSEVLTAQLTQSARTNIMELFRSGKINILVASDLAARGLDVSDLDYVVNFDLPDDSATYVHRVGRTARAGKKGIAVSFVGFEDSFRLERLEKFLGHSVERYQFETQQLEGSLPRFSERTAPRSNAEFKENAQGTSSYGQGRRRGAAPESRSRDFQKTGRPAEARHHAKSHRDSAKLPKISTSHALSPKAAMPVPAKLSKNVPTFAGRIWNWVLSRLGFGPKKNSQVKSNPVTRGHSAGKTYNRERSGERGPYRGAHSRARGGSAQSKGGPRHHREGRGSRPRGGSSGTPPATG